MIHVSIELITHQTGRDGRTLYSVSIVNDKTGTPELGNYNVSVIEHETPKHGRPVAMARVENFPRQKENAAELVRRALNALPASLGALGIKEGDL